ncbi:MAG TPA: FAD:protein FMN transferase [Tepidisphaeraceae bacterium]|nr:FAD:protein FMN transferase [Tepidisphaeraceae bacterium]
MKTNSFRLIGLITLLSMPVLASAQRDGSNSGALRGFQYQQPEMGTVFQLQIWSADEKEADDAAQAAWDRIDQLNQELSDYLPDSELNQLCRRTDSGPMKEPVRVGDDLWNILSAAMEAAKLSDGAFDVTVGPLTRLQRQSRKTHTLPDRQALKDAMSRIGWRYVKMDPAHHSVQLLHAKMQLDVGGIAKGFTSEQVVKLLKQRGLNHVLCGAAGDIAVGDPPPGRERWRIAIQSLKNPEEMSDYVAIRNYGISTSGDTYRSAIIKGERYSHIIDPRSGLGLRKRIGVTTVAPHATTADWVSTAISVLGAEKGLALVERLDGAAARIVTLDEQGHEKVYESKRMPQFLIANPATSAPKPDSVH